MESVSLIAAVSGVPVLAVLIFIGDELGYTDEVTGYIESIKLFYKYTNIKGV